MMKILLDTHIVIWFILDDLKLPALAKELILNNENEIYYSTASIWEVTIKHLIHPDKILVDGRRLIEGCESAGFACLPITNKHAIEIESIKRPENAPRHNDPFDRLLLAQAKSEGMKFLTHDELMPFYNEACLIYAI